jgi:iron(III) transport system substrate-binding protein
MLKRMLIVAISALCILALAACGGTKEEAKPNSPKAEQPSLVELAKKEGKVVFYGATGKSDLEPAFKLFTEKYGISVEYVQQRGSEIVEKLKTESRAGKNKADLMSGGPTPVYELKKEGMLMKDMPKGSENVLGTDPEGFYVGQTLNVYGIMVNTKLVQEKDMPKTWEDLLDPKWKGKMIADDPKAAGGGNSVFTILYEDKRYGEDYLKKLAEQKIVFTRQRDENANAVARGEHAIYIPSTSYTLIRMKDAPVTWIGPKDMTPYLYISRGIMKDAPHPNASRLFSEFMITPEAQKALSQVTTPALKGIDPPIESMKVSYDSMVTQTEKQMEDQNKYYEIFTKIFK